MNHKKERPILGRTIGDSPLSGLSAAGVEQSQRFTLASGHKVNFVSEVIPPEMVENRTYVDPLINGRDQAALTPESLEDITRSLPLQQFFPVIGCLKGDRIEILDGSRRRAAALLCNAGLRVMYTKSEISAADARKLAEDIQTAKEHNIREVGLRLIALREAGMNQKDIAESERMSQAKVTRAIQAASVPETMLTVFPVRSELGYNDYKKLLDISVVVTEKGLSLDELVENVRSVASTLRVESSISHEDVKNEIVKLYDKLRRELSGRTSKKPEVESLKKYEDSRAYARKKSSPKDRKVVYEFCRISKEAQDKIDEAIRKIIEEYE
ncbi:ParB family protein [Cronobacter turicensis]